MVCALTRGRRALVDRVVALAPADSGKLPQPGAMNDTTSRNVHPPSRLARSSPDRLGRDRFPAQQTADDADEFSRRANAIRRPGGPRGDLWSKSERL